MKTSRINVQRLSHRLSRDPGLTITRFFFPGGPGRARSIIERVMRLDAATVSRILTMCLRDFGDHYVNLLEILETHFERAIEQIDDLDGDVTSEKRHLIGAYFTMEYAYASAALFNPSMVPALVQSGLPDGAVRFVMSLRAVGEGHISSIIFRRGIIRSDGQVSIDPVSAVSRRLRVEANRNFKKQNFNEKLIESGSYTEMVPSVLDRLGDTFTMNELCAAIEALRASIPEPMRLDDTADLMQWLAHSNYIIEGPKDADISEMVVFPYSENESNGIEDMRLVQFTDDDGSIRYYGTYTAFNGSRILPQLMEIREYRTLEVHTLGGKYAIDKGMALFPRKIDGRYAMISRIDGEKMYLMTSDSVRFWNEAELIQEPKYPWDFVQIGNCGSPIETDAGWLLITHGVGPMRRYSLGATLLDRDDPTRVIGRLEDPFLVPLPEESEGYVPNVVYSCGGMVHNGNLIIPYGISDVQTGFALVSIQEMLEVLCD